MHAFEVGEGFANRWENAATCAAGIRVPQSVGEFLLLDALRESGGAALAVGEDENRTRWQTLAGEEGLLVCPEGAATFAAWEKAVAQGRIEQDASKVLSNSATGLKVPLSDWGINQGSFRSRSDRHGSVGRAGPCCVISERIAR